MKLQALTVSVNYSDFLQHTIKENKTQFDKWVIVTDLVDIETKNLCDAEGITCIQTDVFYTQGIFNKYAAINEGLKYIDDDAWILFLDSDIVLHKETRRTISKINIDESCLYGMDRLNCVGLEKWNKYKSSNGILMNNWMLLTSGLEFGSRLVHHYGHEGENGRFEGWRPLGYFQLCKRSAFDKYPQNSLGADNCDLDFARLWPREKRILIPELYVIHLESLRIGKTVNWYGRKSQPFDVITPTEEQKTVPVEQMKDFLKKKPEIDSEYIKDHTIAPITPNHSEVILIPKEIKELIENPHPTFLEKIGITVKNIIHNVEMKLKKAFYFFKYLFTHRNNEYKK